MYCARCKDSWPGHKLCPTCGNRLVDLKTILSETRIESLPLMADLAEHFERGRREARRAALEVELQSDLEAEFDDPDDHS